MEHLVLAWYSWLSHLTQGSVSTLQAWSDSIQLPALTAVIFGLIGATAPCQLTTNLGALAFSSARADRRPPFTLALAYVAGKVTVYTAFGALMIVAGLQLQAISIPVVVVARKALGPLMIVVGLALLGRFHFRRGIGTRLAFRLTERLPTRGLGGAYLLGVVFSFAFCPTLFWLFFGLTVPLALRSTGGWLFPSAFAVGSSLPLLVAAGAVAVGVGTFDRVSGGMARLEWWIRRVAGLVLILAGVHDSVIYWML